MFVGVTSAAAGDAYPTVRWSDWKELRPGDRIEAVDGEDLLGASALRFYDLATRAARERGFATVRANRAGTSFDVRVGLTPSAWWWVGLVSALAVLLVAVLLLVRAPGWHLSRRILVMFWCTAAAVAVAERGAAATTSLETHLFWVLVALYAGLAVWNAQEFTLSARPVPRLHRAFAVAALIAVAILYLVKHHLPHTPTEFRVALIAGAGIPAAVVVVGLARAYLRSDLLERRQIRWVILGFYVVSAGGFLGSVASLGGAHPTFSRVVPAISSLGGPIGIVVSVLGYRWLDIDRLLSAAASYTIVGLALVGAMLAVLPRLAHAAAPTAGIDPATAQWLLTMALVCAAIPVHRSLWPRIDRQMFAERHRRTQGFERLLDEIGDYASVEDLVRQAGERVDALLEPDSIALYARAGASFTPLFARGRDAPPSFDADSLLVRALERRGRPLSADATELDAFDRAALETLGVALVVPIRGRDGVVAFACLGRKRSGDIYTPEDIAHLARVSKRCSEVLLRLAEAGSPRASSEPLRIFRRDGEFWTIASSGKEIRLRDMRGLHYLATLLREPGREFRASDLIGAANGAGRAPWVGDPELSVVGGLGDAGEPLDAQARGAYRDRLRELEQEQADAERGADLARLERVSAEREALLTELEGAARGRRASSHGERARTAVTKALKTALDRIAERHPELGAHLSGTIRRGHLCVYLPDPRSRVEWEA